MALLPPSRVIPDTSSLVDASDGRLLDLFIDRKDESAFAELVRRHARMVLGVCQRVLDNPHDAEDCMQAAFLVLVRKADTIKPRDMVGNWLYGVAYRTALEARKMAARRRNREKKKFDMPRPETEADTDRWQELRPLLDQELTRLPDKYRAVLIACDVEGRTRKEVAQAFDLPEGTIASRLSRARAMLAKRLTRRNFSISAVALAAMLANQAEAAFLPPALMATTTEAASLLAAGKSVSRIVSGNVPALMNAVIQSMLIAKLTIGSALLVFLAVIGIGIGALLPSALAEPRVNIEQIEIDAKKEKPEFAQDCVVLNVDPSTGSFEATLPGADGGTSYRFVVDPNTPIVIDGKIAKLADLQVGACVHVAFRRDANGKHKAVKIEAVGEVFEGIVQELNDNRLTVQNQTDKLQKSFEVDRGTIFLVNGKKAKLNELKNKMLVALRTSTGKPVSVNAMGPTRSGIVTKIDPKTRTLALGADAYSIADEARILVDGRQGGLNDLRVGMAITLQMSAETERSFIVAILTAK